MSLADEEEVLRLKALYRENPTKFIDSGIGIENQELWARAVSEVDADTIHAGDLSSTEIAKKLGMSEHFIQQILKSKDE